MQQKKCVVSINKEKMKKPILRNALFECKRGSRVSDGKYVDGVKSERAEALTIQVACCRWNFTYHQRATLLQLFGREQSCLSGGDCILL